MEMATETKYWTLEEVHSLPDDGNKYELIYGELFVTPAPTDQHETILARLTRVLEPYVAEQDLGLVYRPRAVFRVRKDVEVEPDLMVRQPHPDLDGRWETAPIPILVVEVLSAYTRRRDFERKRELYLDEGIPEYWIVDGKGRAFYLCRAGEEMRKVTDQMRWSPVGTTEPLLFDLARVFA